MSEGKTEIYLEGLPRRGKTISWKESKGCKVKSFCNGEEKEFEIVDYERNRKNHLIIRYEGKEFEISTDNFIRCKFSRILGKRTKEFKIKIGTRFCDKDKKGNVIRDITIIDRKYIKNIDGIELKYYKYKCNNPNCKFDCEKHYSIKDKKYKEEFWIIETNLLHGRGCACCSNKVIVEGINDISTTAPWMVKYFKYLEDVGRYTKTSNQKIRSVCPDCGLEKDIFINQLHKKGFSCSLCSDGIKYPNKFMISVLKKIKIKFITEYNPDWIKPKRYDFYIPSMNLMIEMDGEFHFKDNTMSGQTKEESKAIDNEKDRLAKEHGIEVIRIDCDYRDDDKFEYIKKNILKSRLNKYIDLTNVDWIKVGQDCENNIAKESCKIKKNNPDLIPTQIGEMVGVSRQTVTKYLKRGTKLGWCNYDTKEEIRKACLKGGKLRRKPVKIFNRNGVELGIYDSVVRLSRESEKDFGVILFQSGIAEVCRGEKSQYKGFTFKYIEENESSKLHKQELVQAS